jgi:hypothetical protein
MAESKRAKLARWARRDFTKGELQGMVAYLVGDQIVDVATGGRLSDLKLKALRKVVWPVMKGAGKVGGRAGLSLAGSVGRAAIPLATNPYAVGAALGYGALQTEPGQEFLEAAGERGRMDRIRFEQALTDLEVGVKSRVKKTKSKFNKMVSAGMKSVKASTSYGKKGIVNAPKKAFKAVVGAASAVNRGRKLPKTGLKRKLMMLMRRVK